MVKLVCRGSVPSSHARGQRFEPRRRQYFKLLLDPGDFHSNPSRLLSFNKSETVLWTIAKMLLYYINGFENFGIHSTFRPHYRILIFQGWAKRKKSRIFVQKSKLYYGSLFNSYYYWIYNSKEISYVSNRFRIHIQS